MCDEFYNTLGADKSVQLKRSDRIKFNRYIFTKYFEPRMEWCEANNSCIKLTVKDLAFLENFTEKKVVAKTKEWQGFDDRNRVKREMTGACIEYAVLKLFNRKAKFDDSIVASSRSKNHPDLLPLGIICDVKGSSMNNVPLVFKETRAYTCKEGMHIGKKYRCSNIIGITDQKTVWLLGVASPLVLATYVDDNLIMISQNTSKTGFYGVNQLDPIPSTWSEFKTICAKNSTAL